MVCLSIDDVKDGDSLTLGWGRFTNRIFELRLFCCVVGPGRIQGLGVYAWWLPRPVLLLLLSFLSSIFAARFQPGSSSCGPERCWIWRNWSSVAAWRLWFCVDYIPVVEDLRQKSASSLGGAHIGLLDFEIGSGGFGSLLNRDFIQPDYFIVCPRCLHSQPQPLNFGYSCVIIIFLYSGATLSGSWNRCRSPEAHSWTNLLICIAWLQTFLDSRFVGFLPQLASPACCCNCACWIWRRQQWSPISLVILVTSKSLMIPPTSGYQRTDLTSKRLYSLAVSPWSEGIPHPGFPSTLRTSSSWVSRASLGTTYQKNQNSPSQH